MYVYGKKCFEFQTPYTLLEGIIRDFLYSCSKWICMGIKVCGGWSSTFAQDLKVTKTTPASTHLPSISSLSEFAFSSLPHFSGSLPFSTHCFLGLCTYAIPFLDQSVSDIRVTWKMANRWLRSLFFLPQLTSWQFSQSLPEALLSSYNYLAHYNIDLSWNISSGLRCKKCCFWIIYFRMNNDIVFVK